MRPSHEFRGDAIPEQDSMVFPLRFRQVPHYELSLRFSQNEEYRMSLQD
jgi:hypothetical protein